MKEVAVKPKRVINASDIVEICARQGLTLTMAGSLKTLATNTHWHYKLQQAKGVLEITLLYHTNNIILSVHDNRRGGWEDEMIEKLKQILES